MARDDDKATQLRKGALELGVLALLKSGPRYGIEIVDQLAGYPGLDAGAGTIYPLLTRLKNTGLVSTTWQESPSGPPRKYYRLSASGTRRLGEQTAAWQQLSAAMAVLLDGKEGTHD